MTNKNPKFLILTISLLTAITPLAIDIYLPSFTQISNHFKTSIDKVEFTLSFFLLGFALGQLFAGPLSDKYGRKLFIYLGLALFIISSLILSISNTIEQLWLFRFIQAIGGGFIVVNANAIIRDLYSGKEIAKVFSLISMIMLVAPMIAPFIGVSILHFFSWSYIFTFLLLYGILLIAFVIRLPETSPKNSTNMLKNYKTVLQNKKALLIMVSGGLATSGMFIFITKASFIYIEYFNLDIKLFPFFFGANIVTLILLGKLNIKLLQKHSTKKLFLIGVIIQLVSAVFLYIFSYVNSVIITLFCFMFYVGALGFIFGNVKALVLEDFKDISATASALNGIIGFSIASIIGFLSSYFHNSTLETIYLLMIFIALLSLFVLIYHLINNYYDTKL